MKTTDAKQRHWLVDLVGSVLNDDDITRIKEHLKVQFDAEICLEQLALYHY